MCGSSMPTAVRVRVLHAKLYANLYAKLYATARQLDSSTAQQLDSYSTARQTSTATRHPGAWSQPRQASTGSTGTGTGTRQELDRLDRQGLDSPSTAPRRSLDNSTARQPGGSCFSALSARMSMVCLIFRSGRSSAASRSCCECCLHAVCL
jgi:hypothetical protein